MNILLEQMNTKIADDLGVPELKINFRLDEETVQNEMLNFGGTLEEFYHYIRKKYRENNKVLGDFS